MPERKSCTPREAIDVFLIGMDDFFDKTYGAWFDELEETLTLFGMEAEDVKRVLSDRPASVYIAATVASEARAIPNCFGDIVATTLLAELDRKLREEYPLRGHVPDWVATMLRENEKGLAEDPPRVYAITLLMMRLLGLGYSTRGKDLMESPSFIMALDGTLPIWGFWKQFSNNVAVKPPFEK